MLDSIWGEYISCPLTHMKHYLKNGNLFLREE